LGATAIMKGFSAKEANRSKKDEATLEDDFSADKEQLSNELSKLNELLQSGVLTQEEFQKAKDKILNS
jgi:multidrug resistance efflux pump